MTLTFFIPGIPVGKGRPRFTSRGFAYTPAKTRGWENLVRGEASLAMRGRAKFPGAVGVDMTIWLPIPASWSRIRRMKAVGQWALVKPDLDNIAKGICDALQGVVYDDDKYVVQCRAIKKYALTPGVAVSVDCLGAAFDLRAREAAAREAA